jgi:signal transduction histidine kinase
MLRKFLNSLNIRQRLTLQILLMVSVLFLLFCTSIYLFSRLYLNSRFYNGLQERAIVTASLRIAYSADQKALQDLVRNSDERMLTEEMTSIYDPQRDLFVFTTDILKEGFHRSFINAQDTSKAVNNISRDKYKISVIKIKNYWVIISAKDVYEREALNNLRDILIILCLVALLFIAYISWFMADRALSPIASMARQLDAIFPGNLSKRLDYPNKQDEIGFIAKTINQLLQRVESSVNTQRMFIANVSHELKNPLTKIFTQIEIMEMKYKHQPEFYQQIMSLRSDTLMLNQLTNALLELASISSSDRELPLKKLRIDEILLAGVAEFKRWNPDCSVLLNLDEIPDDEELLIFPVNEEALKIVFKNLLDNACKFSVEQKAEVTVKEMDGSLAIDIYNQGKPIPEAEVSKILEPFFRSDATAKGKKGHGVGLAIVMQILLLLKIKLNIVPGVDGNSFILSFPKS